MNINPIKYTYKSSNNLVEFIKFLGLTTKQISIGLVYSCPVGHYLFITTQNHPQNYAIGYNLNHRVSNPELIYFVSNKLKMHILSGCQIIMNNHYLLSRHAIENLEIFPKEIIMAIMWKTIY